MRRLFLVLIVSLVLGCGDDSSDPTGPGPASLGEVTPLVVSGQPLDIVRLAGLEGDPQLYIVEMMGTDGIVLATAPVITFATGSADLAFRVPFNPDSPAGGGPSRLRVASLNATSAIFEFEILPLAAASGEVGRMVTALRTNLELRASLYGTTLGHLAETEWDALASELVPLRAALTILDFDGNPNSLSELATGSAPLLSPDPIDLDLLERVLARVNLLAIINLDNASLQELVAAAPWPANAKATPITSAAELDAAMKLARGSAIRLDPDSAVGQLNQDMSSALAMLGFVPTGATQVASSTLGAIQFTYMTNRAAMANLLPSEFTAIDFDLSHPFFNEDSPETGQWSEVQVLAKSKGWVLDKVVFDGLMNTAGLAGAYSGWIGRVEPATVDDVASALRGYTINQKLADMAQAGETVLWNIEPQQFGPIDITGEPWTRGFNLTERILITFDLNYQPNAVGDDEIEIRIAEGMFGHAYIEKAKPVVVHRILVQVVPTHFTPDQAGQVFSIQATIENADDLGLAWEIGPATWEIVPQGVGTGMETGSIRTPTSVNLYPFTIVASSTSVTGLRASSPEPRTGECDVSFGRSLRVMPPYRCVEPNSTVQLEAIVEGLDNTDVEWSIEEGYGSVSTTGLYTAPPFPGADATVVARSVVDNTLVDFAYMGVGPCACFWEASITGEAFWESGGANSTFLVTTLGEGFGSFNFLWMEPGIEGQDPADRAILSIGMMNDETQSVPGPQQTGTWRMTAHFGLPDGRAYRSEQIGDGPEVLVTIEENDGTFIDGFVEGTLVRRNENDEIVGSVGIAARFHSGLFDLNGEYPCINSEGKR